MTELEQQTVLGLFKQGLTYKQISYETSINKSTVASFLARKHKNLRTLQEILRNKETEKFTARFCAEYGVPDYQARAIYETMRDRFYVKKQNSKADKKIFTIEWKDVHIPTICPILKIKLDYFGKYRDDDYPTYDRTDNTKGYIPGNVEIISWKANRIKNEGSLEDHRMIVDYLNKKLGYQEIYF